jgi:hypothetical protein
MLYRWYQLINASRRCIFSAAALLETVGDVLMLKSCAYIEKMKRDVLPVLDIDVLKVEMRGSRRRTRRNTADMF